MVDLRPLLSTREQRMDVKLSTQGQISMTISWEVEEAYESEVEEEIEDEDVLEGLFGREAEEAGTGDGAAGAASTPAAGAAAAPAKKGPAQPDMLSLSIAISILVKFILFDMVGFLQVNSSLAESMPDLDFPPEFKEIQRQVSSVFNLDFVTELGDANCSLGSNHCYRIMVMMFTLLAFQLAFASGYVIGKLMHWRGRLSTPRLEALVDRSIHGNAIVMMVLHPPITKKLVGIVDCTSFNDVRVLSGFKDIECGDSQCTAVAITFFLVYSVGIPLYVFLSLRAYLSPKAKEKYKGNPILARYRARIGFICGKYEADFWYYELLEMARKTSLMAVSNFIQKGAPPPRPPGRLRATPACKPRAHPIHHVRPCAPRASQEATSSYSPRSSSAAFSLSSSSRIPLSTRSGSTCW